MTELELLDHVEKYNTIKYQNEVYVWKKELKSFYHKDGRRFSLQFAQTHCDEIIPGWLCKSQSIGDEKRLDAKKWIIQNLSRDEISIISAKVRSDMPPYELAKRVDVDHFTIHELTIEFQGKFQ